MGPPALTETTIRYLFATSWLPCNTKQDIVAVPGGATTAIDTAGNLLHIAMWNLRRQGLMEFEQLRPVDKERVRVLGGKSFAGFRLLEGSARLPGARRRITGRCPPCRPGLTRACVLWCGRSISTTARPGTASAAPASPRPRPPASLPTKGRLFRKVVITDQGAGRVAARAPRRATRRPWRLPGRRARPHERSDGRLPTDGRGCLQPEPRRLTSPPSTRRRTR